MEIDKNEFNNIRTIILTIMKYLFILFYTLQCLIVWQIECGIILFILYAIPNNKVRSL